MTELPSFTRADRLLLTLAVLAGLLFGGLPLLAGCDESNPSPDPDPAPFDPNPGDSFDATFGPDFAVASFVADVTNPYFPLPPGTTYRFEGETEDGLEEVVVEVTDETREVAGVTARVVRDRVYLDGELVEDTDDWYAQDEDGNVWYLGEETCEFEDGECVTTAGSWEAGVGGARAGIVMPADPEAGQRYYQEFFDGEAEDRAEVLSTDEAVSVEYGDFTGCVQTYDTTPLDSESREHKYYCAGVGNTLVVDLVTGDRFELVEVTTED